MGGKPSRMRMAMRLQRCLGGIDNEGFKQRADLIC